MVKVTELLMDYEKSQCEIGSMPQLGWIRENGRWNSCPRSGRRKPEVPKARI